MFLSKLKPGLTLNSIPVLPFLRIMGLLSAPQDLPHSTPLLKRVLSLYIFTAMLVLLPGTTDLFTVVVLILLDLAILTGFIKFCLYTRNNSNRFLQTFLACLGAGVFFQLLALPLVLVLNTAAEPAEASSVLGGLYYLLLVSWHVTVIAHILHHAMNMRMIQTILLSFSYFLLVIFITNQVVKFLAAT